MLINPKIMFFWVHLDAGGIQSGFFYSLVSYFKAVFLFGSPAGLYGSAPQSPGPIGSSFSWVYTHPFVQSGGCDLFLLGGGASLDLLSSEYIR